MKKPKDHWLIGINPTLKRIEIRRNDGNNPRQGIGLIGIVTYYGVKVPKEILRGVQMALEIHFPEG